MSARVLSISRHLKRAKRAIDRLVNVGMDRGTDETHEILMRDCAIQDVICAVEQITEKRSSRTSPVANGMLVVFRMWAA
jgi:hypothetical protein